MSLGEGAAAAFGRTDAHLRVAGIRKIIELCVELYEVYEIVGWRQHEHLLKRARQINRQIGRIGARKGTNYKTRLEKQYRMLLAHAEKIVGRATQTCETIWDYNSLL